MSKIFPLFVFTVSLFGYSNCDFRIKAYEDVCKKSVKNGVSYDYVNRFLLSDKTKLRDEKSFDLFHPKKIKLHRIYEKKANNRLVKFVPEMKKHLIKYDEVYAYAEKKYGVNREIIAAILLKETHFSKVPLRHDSFVVFNTLLRESKPPFSKRDNRLMAMAKRNMASIISYCYKKNIAIDKCSFKSSYAGAIGIPQFMPQNFVHVRGYKREVGDLDKMEDAILSVANYLNKIARYKTLIDWKKIPDMDKIESEWYDYAYKNSKSSFAYKNAVVTSCFSCGKKELDYLRGYIKKIMYYNNSSNYAVGVMRLAYDARK